MEMSSTWRAGVVAVVALWPDSAGAAEWQQPKPVSVVERSNADSVRDLEKRFLRVPSAESAERTLRTLTAKPHPAATPADSQVIEFLRAELERLGMDRVEISEYSVWLPHPERVELWLHRPLRERVPNREVAYAEDPDARPDQMMPGWNAYSANDSVLASLVYVNYGLEQDYATLGELGVDVGGKVVMARYGRSHRGVKALEAAKRRAVGLILYSDPADDGYTRGDVYPRGPYRPQDAIQRGNVMYEAEYVGDPLTPGRPALSGVDRDDPGQARNLPKLPVLPISYGSAEPFLRALDGPAAPEGWQGGLPFAYHVGPGPVKAELVVQLDYRLRPVRNVVGTMLGSVWPDEWVILGNHHDSWTYGAQDPGSGTTAVLEIVRGLSMLRAGGWRPRRTIKVAFWGGEEYGQLGSTEWVEEHRQALRDRAVAYVNLDALQAGVLEGAGSPSLTGLVLEAARGVPDPSGGMLYDRWEREQRRAWNAWRPGCPCAAQSPFSVRLNELGGGSDFQAFIDHAGVASLDLSMAGPYGVYHAMQDNFFWYSRFGDPGFRYTRAMAQLVGLILLRMADRPVLPFRYTPYAQALSTSVENLERTNPDKRDQKWLTLQLPQMKEAVAQFERAARRVDRMLDSAERRGRTTERANRALPKVEQLFTDDGGLPSRGWFRHLIYAPDRQSGYAARSLPAVHEALLDGDQPGFEREMRRVVTAVRRATAALDAVSSRH